MRKVGSHVATVSIILKRMMNGNTRKPHLLHTKISSRRKIKEGLVSSCSEEEVLHSEVETNKKMNNKEQFLPGG